MRTVFFIVLMKFNVCISFLMDNKEDQVACLEVSSPEYGVTWPETKSCIISEPPCMNENREFQKRCCTNGIWDSEPVCYYIQNGLSPCPNDFTFDSSKDVCYYRTPATKFPSKCPFEDVLPFYSYLDVIDSLHLGPIWMPINRDTENGLDFFRWIEPSSLYRTVYEETYNIVGKIVGKNCLVYYNSTYILAVSCDERYQSICAYAPLSSINNSYCTQKLQNICKQSDFSPKSKCFCRGSKETGGQNTYKAVEFLQPYQNLLYTSLDENDKCAIALEKNSSGKYYWTQSNSEINYTNWSPQVVFDTKFKYGAVTKAGWILLNDLNSQHCYIYSVEVAQKAPELQLTYESVNNIFTVTVTNPGDLKWLEYKTHLLIYCFTDSSSYDLLYRYENLTPKEFLDNRITYQFVPNSRGPGYYWCESFKYPDLQVVQSNRILLRPDDRFFDEYVAILQIGYIEGTNPLNRDLIEFVQRVLFIRLQQAAHLEQFYKSRVSKILAINENLNKFTINLHITSTNQSAGQEEFDYLENLLNQVVLQIDMMQIKLQKFLSVDFCHEETTTKFGTNLTWPRTQTGQVTYPKEFCFKNDSLRLSRLCTGSFDDGAMWAEIVDKCQIPLGSELTNDLLDLLNSEDDINTIIENVTEISKQFQDFEPFDVYLIAEILDKVEKFEDINLGLISQIVSNLHEIGQKVLFNSQLQMNSTDKILQNVDDIARIASKKHTNTTVVTKNFALIVTDFIVTNLTGVVIQTGSNSWNLTLLKGDLDWDQVIEAYPKLDVAVLFQQSLLNQIEVNSSKIIVTLYSSNALFNEITPNGNVSSKIFGVIIPDFYDDFTTPLTILHNFEATENRNCVHWNYGQNIQGFWEFDEVSSNLSSFALCEFWHLTHFGLLLVNDEDFFDQIDKIHLLDLITTINCGLSVIGLFGVLLTGLLFKKWRKNIGNQILIHFAIALVLQIALLYISNIINDYNKEDKVLCTVIGCLLHYSIISEFCWMLIIAILQFKRFVEVLGGPPNYILLKACLCGWVLPLLPVLCVILLDDSTYVLSDAGLCYPTGLSLYLGVWLPIAIIVLINLVIFIYIIFNVVHRKTECTDVVGNNEILFQWRLAVLLFFMLGLTWSFGFLTQFFDFGIIFVYLFCFTATLQGFVMFLFFIVFNQNTRHLYLQAVKNCWNKRKYY